MREGSSRAMRASAADRDVRAGAMAVLTCACDGAATDTTMTAAALASTARLRVRLLGDRGTRTPFGLRGPRCWDAGALMSTVDHECPAANCPKCGYSALFSVGQCRGRCPAFIGWGSFVQVDAQ